MALNNKKGRILVVDDNQGIRNALKILLPAYFAQVELIASPKTLVSTMESFHPNVQIVLFTAYADIALAVEGMKHRINTMHICLPALRERPEDILPLAERFLSRFAEKYRRTAASIDPHAANLLKFHLWNGNLTLVAKELGISRPTLYSKLKKYDI